MGGVFGHGMLTMGFVAQSVTDWAGAGAVRKLGVRFAGLVRLKDVITCKGRVLAKSSKNGTHLVEVDLWAENQKGELVMKGQSQIQLFYSLEDENRQRSGQAPIVVHVPRETIKPPAEAPAPTPAAPASAAASANVLQRVIWPLLTVLICLKLLILFNLCSPSRMASIGQTQPSGKRLGYRRRGG
jgi:hypothetical protein